MTAKYFVIGAMLTTGLMAMRTPAQDAPAATQSTGTMINIHMKQALAEDAFDELAKQGGIKFSTNGGNLWEQDSMQSGIDIDLSNRSFWSATLELCDLWNLSIQPGNFGPQSSGRRITLQQMGGRRHTGKLPVCESQGFVIQAVSFNRQQSVNYTSPDNSQNFCSVQLMVYVDPAVHLQSLNQNVKADEAVDDAGHSMIPDASNRMFYGGGNQPQSLVYNCNVPLKYPDSAGKKIAELKCTLQMRGGDKVEALSVDKPLSAEESSKDFGNMSITFHSLKKNGEMYELKLSVTRDDPNGGNDWNLLQNGQLLDEKGRPFAYGGGGGGGGDGSGTTNYTVNYNGGNGGDSGPGDPVKWVIEMPANPHTIRVPVEFKDLPLP